MSTSEDPDFLASMGSASAEILRPLAGEGGVSAQDVYSVMSEFEDQPLTPEYLCTFTSNRQEALAAAFNFYFEVSSVSQVHISDAMELALRRWSP